MFILNDSCTHALGDVEQLNLLHQLHRLLERHHDALVVGDVLGGEGAAWLAARAPPVVQPLVADLVAADVEVPHVFGDAVEVGAARPPRSIQVDLVMPSPRQVPGT